MRHTQHVVRNPERRAHKTSSSAPLSFRFSSLDTHTLIASQDMQWLSLLRPG
jgi:hypothetical protein